MPINDKWNTVINGWYWVSVGGNDCEVARMQDGKIFTTGCADGTEYEEGCGIEVMPEILNAPRTSKERARYKKIWEENIALRRGISHGYRKFN